MNIDTNYAPIILFVYKRPEHTRKVIESLFGNAEFFKSHFYVFCDGSKKKDDESLVIMTREVVKSFDLSNITIIERDKNLGLSQSIIRGVTELFSKYDRIIVLEDDLIVSPFFLDYMNRALSLYENCEKVMQISGYMFPIKIKSDLEAIFLPFTTTWSWATWKRAWDNFNDKISNYEILNRNRCLRAKFDLNRSFSYFKMLKDQKKGKIDSWGICWYLSVFLKEGLVLYPTVSFVQNIGSDGSGTHRSLLENKDYIVNYKRMHKFPEINIDSVNVDYPCFEIIKDYLRWKDSFFLKLTRRVKSVIIK